MKATSTTLPLYQIDAFAHEVFTGNPAAICPLNEWLSDELMQQIAMENNLAETAFYVEREGKYEIRWFTPTMEVDLCGHATLAAAFVLFNYEGYRGDAISFYSPRSGELVARKEKGHLTLSFPADVFEEVKLTEQLLGCFDEPPIQAFRGKTDYMLVFKTEQQIRYIKPNFNAITQLGGRGVIVTSRGNDTDFVSRFFAPQAGINEDPVTGSAHTTLTPYWSKVLNKKELVAMQLSSRTGKLWCSDLGDRIEISGDCKIYLKGEVYL